MDRVNWVTRDCFNAIAQLTQLGPHETTQPDMVHMQMRRYLEALQGRGREAGYPEQDIKLMSYALAALADEVVMSTSGKVRDIWAAQPLQMVMFSENTAGENFFGHLEQVRQNPQQIDVLRVFFQCMVLGFQGKYAVRGGEVALSDLTFAVRTQLLRALPMPEVLAPNGPRPEEGLLDASRKLPIVWMAFGLLTLTGVLYLGLTVSLRDELQLFVSWMSQAIGAQL